MRASLQLRLGQQLAMTPQLRQAIGLLQLSAQELQAEVRQALENNVMLMPGDDVAASESADEYATASTESSDSDYTLDTDGLNDWPSDESPADNWLGNQADPFENLAAAGESLQDHLRWQIGLGSLTSMQADIADAIIDALGEDGYLRDPLDAVVSHLDIPIDAAEAVLRLVQTLDPAGVGARDLRECLQIQLNTRTPGAVRDIASRIIATELEAMARDSAARLAHRLKLGEPQVNQALELIRSLDPRPGNRISNGSTDYVVPDLLLVHHDNRWDVVLNSAITPQLTVNQRYLGLLRQSREKSETLQAQLQEARWLIRSIKARNDTLSRVAREIVSRQQDYFHNGDEAMKPLLLRDIADATELHESTISRVTSNKYLLTPRGTLSLKYFFSPSLPAARGSDTSAIAVRAIIRRLINEENPSRPLSDMKIADELTDRGIRVARRTVTKYREAMHIPASHERKSPLAGNTSTP